LETVSKAFTDNFMILRRIGNKKKLMPELLKHFPLHNVFVDVFFGSGSAFFYKPKVKYNICNDIDGEVYNLFQVLINKKQELIDTFYIMPIHSDLLEFWKKNTETEPIKKALRFLFLSNFTYLGMGDTLKVGTQNSKKICGS